MSFETLFDIVLLLITAGICGLAVYHPRFDDTLVQRIALGCMCLGCLGLAWWLRNMEDPPQALSWCIWSASLFALETGRKVHAKVKNGTFREVNHGT